ncbi:glycosyltransferase family 2 protein [Lactobacillus delbrueckii]|uniref:glycosyltransferase family 2 protein n=1 Tax=Lactobacillus delbrueckii TaxID=1584 RepID=UPI001E37C871|nr:glycosyltransferase family 2 protein [Lactobacillus delbrueckii]MCD5470692.1 glycosyltransferase family 2 protein [Lactobacillus delbrueckii subsp. bulgaricus]MCT3514152.1 glycosyltransferase family 2 protein [Lactobacillus delbrueckii subsp. bulgaricus]
MTKSIIAGVVTYNPRITLLQKNLSALRELVDRVIVVDNGSVNLTDIKKIIGGIGSISLIENQRNLGIARALNEIMETAIEYEYSWVLTMDQDSVVPTNLVSEYVKYLDSSVGMLCPIIFDRNKNQLPTTYLGTHEVKECITSGSLVNVSAWQKVNGFDEKLFIDGVDFDFCERIKKTNYRILEVGTVVLSHAIGNITMRKFFFWDVAVKNHSAFRKYYIARNTIYLAKKNGNVARQIKSYLQVAKQVSIVIMYEQDKKKKLIAICRGIIEGVHDF